MKILRRSLTLALTLAVFLAGFSFPESQGNAVAEIVVPSGISGTNDVGEQPDELLQSGEWLYYLDGNEAIIAGYELAIFSPNFLKIDHLVPSGFVAVMGLYYSPPG